MGKYDRLHEYLRRHKDDALEMSFAEIERRIGALLPNSAARPEWWSDGRGVQHRAWADLGYTAHLVHPERVRFSRQTA